MAVALVQKNIAIDYFYAGVRKRVLIKIMIKGEKKLGLDPCVIRARGELMEFVHCERGTPVYERK